MKRFLTVGSFVLLGLVVTWACLYAGSHIDWPKSTTPTSGCREIDHCDVPWWVSMLFVASLLGPAVVYGLVAFIGTGRQWASVRWFRSFSILIPLTAAIYFGGYAYEAFR